MPLKKPTDVPKLPKTRKKNPEAMKEAIPQKKEDKIEYICIAGYKADELEGKQYSLLRIQTVAVFTSFAYEVSVDAKVDKGIVDITIMGLSTKMNYVPKVESAKSDVLLKDLNGKFTVNVIKQDGSINSAIYEFNFYNKEITLIEKFMPEKKNNRIFCDFVVADPGSFTFLPDELRK